jgi:hypothetical protein
MLAPHKSFIIVDEPENHLNPAIYNTIWDKLLNVRKDCQFIFISHTMEFITARKNYEIIKIRRFTHNVNAAKYDFDFEFCENGLEDIDKQFIVDIIGSRQKILFCEGIRGGIDYRIYSILFGRDYTIIPCGNSYDVRKQTNAVRNLPPKITVAEASGIIDSDLMDAKKASNLKTKRIFTLKCNEIEMLLLDESIYKNVRSDFTTYKTAFFSEISTNANKIIARLVKTQIENMPIGIDDKNNPTKAAIKNNFNKQVVRIKPDALWDKADKTIKKIISSQNYRKAIRYCCLQHGEIIVNICGQKYIDEAINKLSESLDLQNTIRKKYFASISYEMV